MQKSNRISNTIRYNDANSSLGWSEREESQIGKMVCQCALVAKLYNENRGRSLRKNKG